MSFRRRVLALALVLLTSVSSLAQSRRTDQWVATWATSLVARPQGQGAVGGTRGQGPAPSTAQPAQPSAGPTTAPAPAATAPGGAPAGRQGGPPPLAPVTISNQTIREIVHVSIGGNRVRVVLSNAFGTAPIQIGAAHVALRAEESSISERTAKPLTFGGSTSATIRPGAVLFSDPVDLALPPLGDLVVDIYFPGELGIGPSPLSTHNGSSQTNYLSIPGDHSGQPSIDVSTRTTSWLSLARVEVLAPAGTAALVAFGDSITDGARSTQDMNSRWPDSLARRLAARRGAGMAVLNAGISGNQVLGDGAGVSALARFDRDVLMQTGVTHVIVMEGINDIGIARNNPTPSAADLIAGHKQIVERAHARGLKIIGATLTPFEGAPYFTQEGETKRQALNQWIRTGGAYDGVIDFDQITRDPNAPTKFLPLYDSGDHLHPGDAGYKAMGEAVDLKLFKE